MKIPLDPYESSLLGGNLSRLDLRTGHALPGDSTSFSGDDCGRASSDITSTGTSASVSVSSGWSLWGTVSRCCRFLRYTQPCSVSTIYDLGDSATVFTVAGLLQLSSWPVLILTFSPACSWHKSRAPFACCNRECRSPSASRLFALLQAVQANVGWTVTSWPATTSGPVFPSSVEWGWIVQMESVSIGTIEELWTGFHMRWYFLLIEPLILSLDWMPESVDYSSDWIDTMPRTANSREANWGPLSENTVSGMPHLANTSSIFRITDCDVGVLMYAMLIYLG